MASPPPQRREPRIRAGFDRRGLASRAGERWTTKTHACSHSSDHNRSPTDQFHCNRAGTPRKHRRRHAKFPATPTSTPLPFRGEHAVRIDGCCLAPRGITTGRRHRSAEAVNEATRAAPAATHASAITVHRITSIPRQVGAQIRRERDHQYNSPNGRLTYPRSVAWGREPQGEGAMVGSLIPTGDAGFVRPTYQ